MSNALPPSLSEQLGRFEKALASIGAPIVGMLRPGLTDEEIDELMAPTGITLPEELRVWWRWHDGADVPPEDVDDFRSLGFGSWEFISLREAISLHSLHQEGYEKTLAQGSSDMAERSWRTGLFPLTGRVWKPNHVLAVDTFAAVNGAAPVSLVTEMGIEPDVSWSSVSDIVALWTELLESGRYHLEDGDVRAVDDFHVEEPRFLNLN